MSELMIDECGHCDIERAFRDPEQFLTHVETVHPEVLITDYDGSKKTPSGANAPYKIVPVGKKFAVKNNAGETKATFDTRAKANKYLSALYANVKGAPKRAAKTPFTGKAKNRVPTAKAELASDGTAYCGESGCNRSFTDPAKLLEHAEAVHTFSDIQEMLREAVRDKYYVKGDYRATPPIPSNWVYVVDAADDWVVFEVENDGDSKLLKAGYSIVDNKVTLGEPTEVVRKTVYEPVKTSTSEED